MILDFLRQNFVGEIESRRSLFEALRLRWIVRPGVIATAMAIKVANYWSGVEDLNA